MGKEISAIPLVLNERPTGATLTHWLYQELRHAILDGRLQPGTRLPATRDFAVQQGLSRGTVVTVFEQLQAEGYLVGRVGAGTRVSDHFSPGVPKHKVTQPRVRKIPSAIRGVRLSQPASPFRPYQPALTEFPVEIWARVAGRRLRRASAALLAGGDPRGYLPLREVIADYLGSSRGVRCSADSVVVLSGVQQGLDLIARLLIQPGECVWMEDPGYFGAITAFRQAGARIVPVPVDQRGLVVSTGRALCKAPKAAYVTPAHQFPMGVTMPLERRLEILAWAREAGSFVIEDDYDSEYRFDAAPVPALQGLDKTGSVVFLGSFNKVLFPSLRLGYMVLPASLIDSLLTLRLAADFYPPVLDQAILHDFMIEGHLGRHIRKMRDMYAIRFAALQEHMSTHLRGVLEMAPIRAGLNAPGFLRNGMRSQQAEVAAARHGLETWGLHRFALKYRHPEGVLLGFAAFDEREIRRGVVRLASALEKADK